MSRINHGSGSRLHSAALELLLTEAIRQFYVAGNSGQRLAKLISKCERRANAIQNRGRSYIGDAAAIAEVLYRWNNDTRYLTSRASPKALTIRSTRAGLHRLVRSTSGADDSHRLIEEMRRLKLVRQKADGTLLPSSDETVIASRKGYVLDFLAQSAVRLVLTGLDNSSQSRTEHRQIQKLVYVRDLPLSKVRAFKALAHQQGRALASTINNWLETNRVPTGGREKHCEVSLLVFSHVGKVSARGK